MSKRHQVWWTSLHLPFHIALVLLLEGSNQFIIWARVNESINIAIDKVLAVEDDLGGNITSAKISNALGGVIMPFITKYQPANVLKTWTEVTNTLANISSFPDTFWAAEDLPLDDPTTEYWERDIQELLYTMVNAIFNAFGVEAAKKDEKSLEVSGETTGGFDQTMATEAIGARYGLVVCSPIASDRCDRAALTW